MELTSFRISLTKLFLLVVSLRCSCGLKTVRQSQKRFDQMIPQFTVGNSANGVQFYAHPGTISPAMLYPAIQQPAVFLPGQFGLDPVLPNPNIIPQSFKDIYETSTPSYHRYNPVLRYRPPVRSLHTKSYNTRLLNSNGLSSYSSPSFSIQQSVDLSDATPNLLTTAVPPLTGTTYGPPRPVDITSKRLNMIYHKGHRYPYMSQKHVRGAFNTYTHKHRDHYHTHHFPYQSQSTPLYQTKPYPPRPTQHPQPYPPRPTQHPQPYSPRPTQHPQHQPPQYNYNYLPSQAPTTQQPPLETEKPHNYHAWPSAKPEQTRVRFPNVETLKTNEPHPDLTQALIGRPNEITNNDVSIPYRLPADGNTVADQNKKYQHYNDQTLTYFGSAPDSVFQNSPFLNNEEVNNNFIQNYQLEQDQVRGTETMKIPVAVIPVMSAPGGLFRYNVKRSDDESKLKRKKEVPVVEGQETDEANSAEWIPMNGANTFRKVEESPQVKKPARRMLDEINSKESIEQDELIIDRESNNNYRNHRVIPKHQPSVISLDNYRFPPSNSGEVGDIISGKIPGGFNPFSDSKLTVQNIDLKNGMSSNVVTSKISFGDNQTGQDVRKVGKVIDEINPILSRLRGGQTNEEPISDLVVSSVLKFT